MKKMLVMMLCAAMTMSMTVPAMAAEASDSVDLSENVTIRIGGIDQEDSDNIDGWPLENIAELEEKLNVTFEMEYYDKESYNLDLAGGNTTDIVVVTDEYLNSVLKGKHAVNLEEYADYAGNILSDQYSFRNNVMKKFKSNGEDKLYFVSGKVTVGEPVESVSATPFGYVVRWDLYKEIGCPEIRTTEDYVEALKKMKEIYPETEEGLPTYALGAYNETGLHPYYIYGCLALGYNNMEGGMYVQNVTTNELIPDVYDKDLDGQVTPFWETIKLYRMLYQEGLLDPDNFITKGEDLVERYTKGQYLGGYMNWHYGIWNSNKYSENPESLEQYIVLPNYMGWTNDSSTAGERYMYVSSHSKNIERAVMVLDYLQSEEWARKLYNGADGRWEVGEDGAALTEDTISMKVDPERQDEYAKSGIQQGTMITYTGLRESNVASDGKPINLWIDKDIVKETLTPVEKDMCETLGVEIPADILNNRIEAGEAVDRRNVNSLIPNVMDVIPDDIKRINSNCDEIAVNMVPDLVMASEEDFPQVKETLLQELEGAGVKDSIDWYMDAWNRAKESVDSLK